MAGPYTPEERAYIIQFQPTRAIALGWIEPKPSRCESCGTPLKYDCACD